MLHLLYRTSYVYESFFLSALPWDAQIHTKNQAANFYFRDIIDQALKLNFTFREIYFSQGLIGVLKEEKEGSSR